MSTRATCLLAFLVAPVAACGTSAAGGPAAPSSSIPSTPSPPPLPAPSPTSSPTTGGLPVGSFRVEPPGAPGRIISIPAGAAVHVHGSGFSAPDDEPLTLFADWGDGTRGRDYCGPCRVQHAYTTPGTFKLVATIVDPQGGVSRSWTVVVN